VTFKAPKVQPRNPANQPDELETRVLDTLTKLDKGKGPTPEHYEIDKNLVI